MSIPKPWTPVTTVKTGDRYEINVLNRKYTLDGQSTMFSSIISDGEELLASPIRFVAKSGEEQHEFCKALSYKMEDTDDGESATVFSTYEAGFAILNVSHTVEYDGCDEITLTVMPKGRTVAECFGIEKYDPTAFHLDTLYMEVPLRKEAVKYFNVNPVGGVVFNNPDEKDTSVPDTIVFNRNGVIPKSGLHGPFQAQIYLNGDSKGIGFFFDSDKNFHFTRNDTAFEIENREDEIILRIRFFDRTPDYWLDKGNDDRFSRDLMPIQYRFGMQVTPVKLPENRLFTEKNFHVDCYCKIPREMMYDEYFSGNVIDGKDEIGFDRIKRLGVDTLYIHEKWNDIQNSPEITEETAKRLKFIIEECHKRGIKVVPYFGYEIATVSPFFKKYGDMCIIRDEKKRMSGNVLWSWYRFPYQRDLRACLNSDFLDYFYEGLVALHKRFGFDGFYFDSISSARQCANTEHGCGWEDEDGFVHYTYQNYAIRKFFKKVYAYASENDLIINLHTNGVYTLSCIGFCTSLWEGETVQSQFLNGNVKRVPENLMRAMFSARDLGVPMYTLCYSREGVWEYQSGAAIALLYGSIPKPVDIAGPLEYTSKLWKIFDEFPLEKAQWLSYYGGNDIVLSDNDEVKVSIYKAEGRILAICCSMNIEFAGEVTISSSYRHIKDALTGSMLSDGGKCSLSFKGIECKILDITE